MLRSIIRIVFLSSVDYSPKRVLVVLVVLLTRRRTSAVTGEVGMYVSAYAGAHRYDMVLSFATCSPCTPSPPFPPFSYLMCIHGDTSL